jgi:Ni,Fe-hydrogenase maturation factor
MEGKTRRKILVFGNPMLKQDSIPLLLLGRLKDRFPEFEFKEFDPNENLEREGRDICIVDTVEGIDKAMLITDIDSIKTQKIYSMHDFDLGYTLKLLKKLGYIDSVLIFGVPMKITTDEAFRQLCTLISVNLS